MNRRFLFILGFCTVLLPLHSQLRFQHLESDTRPLFTYDMLVDSYGYLWTANANGLMRYDGYELKRYYESEDELRRTRSLFLSSALLTSMVEDGQKRLWIGSRNGLNRYDRDLDAFVRYWHDPDNPNSISANSVVIFSDPNKNVLWCLSDTDLDRYDEANDRFDRFPFTGNLSEGETFTDALFDPDGSIWVVGTRNTIWNFQPASGEYRSIEAFEGDILSPKKIHRDNDGLIWITSRIKGLFHFLPKEKRVERFQIYEKLARDEPVGVGRLVEYPKGQLIVMIENGGLVFIDKKTWKVRQQTFAEFVDSGLSSDRIYALYVDPVDTLWLGHARAGIDFHPQLFQQFATYRRNKLIPDASLPHDSIGCFFEDQQGTVLIGTDGGGICAFDKPSQKVAKLQIPLRSEIIRKIDQSSDGRIWVAMWNGGVQAFYHEEGEYRTDERVNHTLQKFQDEFVWDLEVDSQDRIWVSTTEGTIHLYQKDLTFIDAFRPDPDEKTGFSSSIQEIAPNTVLVTSSSGVFRFNESEGKLEKFIHVKGPTTFAWDETNEIYYVGTGEHGVHSFDRTGHPLEVFTMEDGLPDNQIRSIEVIGENEVWTGTLKGLCRLDPQNRASTIFYESDGLQGNQYFRNASYKSRDGRLWFGGTTGFSTFDPASLTVDQNAPHVYINEVELFGTPLRPTDDEAIVDKHPQALDSLELQWNQNHLKFGFTAIHLTQPDRNRFAYKLEGFENKWNHTDASQRNATYTNIAPGTYTFRVKAANANGVWNETGASLSITILPPFWQRIEFIVCVSIITLLLLLAIINALLRYQKRKHDREERRLSNMVEQKTRELQAHKDHLEHIVSERTKELVIAKENAEKSDQLKSQFLANLSHEIRTPLNAIIGLSALVTSEDIDRDTLKSYAAIIEGGSNDLLKLIENIMDYSMIVSNQLSLAEKSFSLNELVNNTYDSQTQRKDATHFSFALKNELSNKNLTLFADPIRISQILEHLLDNAIKFTEQGTIELSVFQVLDTISFAVKDDGPGIPKSERAIIFDRFVRRHADDLAARRGVGLGLALSKGLAELMGGKLAVESQEGIGSTFTLSLPIKTKAADTTTQNPASS